MFLNCLLLDLTFTDLMSIVHVDKIWVEIAKKFEMRTSGGGGGGGSVISDTPGRGGEGGSKKGKFLRTSFMDGPLQLTSNSLHGTYIISKYGGFLTANAIQNGVSCM